MCGFDWVRPTVGHVMLEERDERRKNGIVEVISGSKII